MIDGETGFLVQPGDVEALTERMPHLRPCGSVCQAIFEKVKREFSIDATWSDPGGDLETILRRLSLQEGARRRASSSAEPMETAMWVMRPF